MPIVLAAASAFSSDPFLFVWIFLGVVFASWLISLWVHPWRHCRVCDSVPRTYGGIFPGSFRICTHCGGTGRQKRFMADLWSKNREL